MPAECVDTLADIRLRVAEARAAGQTIGLVPTMGALHAGHGALIERARRETGCVAVSIFVNPIQFDRKEDFDAYRIDLGADLDYCSSLGADLVFAPSAAEMYPAPPAVFVDVAGLADHLCGRFRPGHFRGVASVVAKLFHIVQPDRAYFGEKDAQQLAVIRRMVVDLDMPLEIVPVPTVREPDGLAMSSRNRRLTAEERRAAPLLYRALLSARERIAADGATAAEARASGLHLLETNPSFRVEYFEVVDPATMAPVDRIAGPVIVAAAAWLGGTRLIDNVYCPRP